MTSKTVILQPVFALVAWTIGIMLLLSFHHLKEARAARSASKGDTSAASPKESSASTLANRNYMNLLEAPVLFYVACVIAYVTDTATLRIVTVAWIYVGLRVGHSLIHVTYNRVAHRSLVFTGSIVVLVLLWSWIAAGVFGSTGAA
jgi:hypothetical protein